MTTAQIQVFDAASATSVFALNNAVRIILFLIATLWIIWVLMNSFTEIQSGDTDKPFSSLFGVILRVGIIYAVILSLLHR